MGHLSNVGICSKACLQATDCISTLASYIVVGDMYSTCEIRDNMTADVSDPPLIAKPGRMTKDIRQPKSLKGPKPKGTIETLMQALAALLVFHCMVAAAAKESNSTTEGWPSASINGGDTSMGPCMSARRTHYRPGIPTMPNAFFLGPSKCGKKTQSCSPRTNSYYYVCTVLILCLDRFNICHPGSKSNRYCCRQQAFASY